MGRNIQFIKLLPTETTEEIKYLLLGVDIDRLNVYRLIEIGMNDTRTTLTLNSHEFNLSLPEDYFEFNAAEYPKLLHQRIVKIIDRYILTSYLARLASVFIILMFIFIIQTFWLFIDEFAGKGLDAEIILKFLTYYTPKLYPLVMPLSVLLASIMTYGTFAENYEFAAMKSNGISLQRALLGLTIFHFFLGIGSYYFSNHVIPYGEFKYFNLRRNLAKLKPALAITEGIFNEIGEMNIKVTEKYGENNRFLKDVIIHEKSSDNKNRIVIKAKRGELKSASIDQELQLVLFDGNRYEELYTNKAQERKKIKHAKVSFKEYVLNIDLSQFNNVDLGKKNTPLLFACNKSMSWKKASTRSKKSLNKNKLFMEKTLQNRVLLII